MAPPVWFHSAVGQDDIITCTIPLQFSHAGCCNVKLFVITVISGVELEHRDGCTCNFAMCSDAFQYCVLLL